MKFGEKIALRRFWKAIGQINMGYVREIWNNSPTWAKTTLCTALIWGTFVNIGNVLIAKRELNKGYNPIEAEEQIRKRIGQFYPRVYVELTFRTGTPGRKLVYNVFY